MNGTVTTLFPLLFLESRASTTTKYSPLPLPEADSGATKITAATSEVILRGNILDPPEFEPRTPA